MKYLIINSGSSSIKYKLFEMSSFALLASGLIEKIGEKDSAIKNHKQGFETMESLLVESGVLKSFDMLSAIGHRVVHGGEKFKNPVLIDDGVIQAIRELIQLAPLHNPANLEGIKSAMEHSKNIPNIAVFDTAFHQTLPNYAYLYALPYEMYEKHQIRRYGFHGTSHSFVAKKTAEYLKKPLESLNLITLHLGNGVSIAAIKNGKSIDTSMGMTPLEGLIMGTRSGDIDGGVIFYLARNLGLGIDEIDMLLNKNSGLKGICKNNDLREITNLAQSGDKFANLAIEMFVYRIKKYIGSYLAILGKVDAIIFTGGIGENSIKTREKVCAGLENIGIILDNDKNSQPLKDINKINKKGEIKLFAVRTNEELEIAIQMKKLLIGD